MWKKLTLMQILTNHGVPQIPELFEDYKARLSEHVQELHDVRRLTDNHIHRIFIRIISAQLKQTIGLWTSIVNALMNMTLYTGN